METIPCRRKQTVCKQHFFYPANKQHTINSGDCVFSLATKEPYQIIRWYANSVNTNNFCVTFVSHAGLPPIATRRGISLH